MKIVQDPTFDQRWVICPEPGIDAEGVALLSPTSMARAKLAYDRANPGSVGDFWFHAYAARRLKGWGDTGPLLAWLRKAGSGFVWQPVASDMEYWGDGLHTRRIRTSCTSVALVIFDRSTATKFKMSLHSFTAT